MRKSWSASCGQAAVVVACLTTPCVAPAQETPVLVERQGTKYTRREVFLAFWIADRLAEAISAEPSVQPYLRPRAHPLCVWEGASVYFPTRERRARLTARQQAILARVDGARTVGAIARRWGSRPRRWPARWPAWSPAAC